MFVIKVVVGLTIYLILCAGVCGAYVQEAGGGLPLCLPQGGKAQRIEQDVSELYWIVLP